LNIYVAATRTVRTMNWMHACFGIGATIGPLVMTWILGANLSWRLGYALAGFIHVSLAICYFFVVGRLDFRGMKEIHAADSPIAQTTSAFATLRLPIVILSVLLFFLYTGVETTTGQWSYSLFVEERSISPYLAGVMVSLFWAMLTIGRIVFGAAAERIGLERLLRLSMMGVVVAAVLFLFQSPWISLITVGLMGLSLSAIFPTLTSDTPQRVSLRHANHAIGLQTGAASVGVAVLPSLAGFLAERFSLEIIGPFLIVSALLLAVTNEIVVVLVRRRARQAFMTRQSAAD
jgi:fucose permease